MKESHAEQLVILIGFIFVLILAIAVPIVVSVLRKRHKPPVVAPETSDAKSEIAVPSKSEAIVLKSAEVSLSTDAATTKQDNVIREVAEKASTPVESTRVGVAPKELAPTKLADALKNTESHFWGRIKGALSLSGSKKRDDVLEQIEEILYTSDLGPALVETWLENLKDKLSDRDLSDFNQVQSFLRSQMVSVLEPLHKVQANEADFRSIVRNSKSGPTVIMIVGVNGAGKTTTIGKLAAHLAAHGSRVLVAAGDTFRAAAGGQLKGWTDRAQAQISGTTAVSDGEVEIFWPPGVSDPAAVAYDSVEKAKAQKFDFVLLDTAGRLHNQSHLMDELKKVKRVLSKAIADAPHETWIVLDGNAGQNAVLQAREFHQALQLSGIVLTKLDGTAKGGAALSAVHQLQIPIRLIGVGEKVNDLRIFNWSDYVDAIIGLEK